MSDSNPSEKIKHHSYTRKILVAIGIIFPIILLLFLFGYAFKLLLLITTAVLVAAFFRGIARFIRQKIKMPRGWSLLLSVVLVLGLVVVLNLLMAPQVADQVRQMEDKIPQTMDSARNYLDNYEWGRSLLDEIPQSPQKFLKSHQGWFQQTFGVVSTTFNVLADIYIIILLAMFFMAQPEPYVRGMAKLFPPTHRDRAKQVLHQVYITLERWLLGKLLSMLVVAILTTLGLILLGVPLALVLGLLAGLLSFIPNFGPLIALIPAILMSLLQGPQMVLYVVLMYVGVQAVESNLITPLIQQRMISLPLAMIIIAQILLGILTGVFGIILAAPILAIVVVLVKTLYVEDVLEK